MDTSGRLITLGAGQHDLNCGDLNKPGLLNIRSPVDRADAGLAAEQLQLPSARSVGRKKIKAPGTCRVAVNRMGAHDQAWVLMIMPARQNITGLMGSAWVRDENAFACPHLRRQGNRVTESLLSHRRLRLNKPAVIVVDEAGNMRRQNRQRGRGEILAMPGGQRSGADLSERTMPERKGAGPLQAGIKLLAELSEDCGIGNGQRQQIFRINRQKAQNRLRMHQEMRGDGRRDMCGLAISPDKAGAARQDRSQDPAVISAQFILIPDAHVGIRHDEIKGPQADDRLVRSKRL